VAEEITKYLEENNGVEMAKIWKKRNSMWRK
jgi:hypothetical protein